MTAGDGAYAMAGDDEKGMRGLSHVRCAEL